MGVDRQSVLAPGDSWGLSHVLAVGVSPVTTAMRTKTFSWSMTSFQEIWPRDRATTKDTLTQIRNSVDNSEYFIWKDHCIVVLQRQ